ncbi:MAG: hypothetical protein LC725_10450 [Lentisphaerae bacterium]|nr:hypothetical protein [Lentisphaerota bacterium]
MQRIIKLFVLYCGLTACAMAASGGFDLKINDLSELDEPWPLVAGLPFPEGLLRDLSQVRIMQGNQEVPAQIDSAATWRDGTVRWAQAVWPSLNSGLTDCCRSRPVMTDACCLMIARRFWRTTGAAGQW